MADTPKHVPWWTFATVVSAAVAFGMFIYWQVDGVRSDVSAVRTDVAVVKTDTAWIKEALRPPETALSKEPHATFAKP